MSKLHRLICYVLWAPLLLMQDKKKDKEHLVPCIFSLASQSPHLAQDKDKKKDRSRSRGKEPRKQLAEELAV